MSAEWRHVKLGDLVDEGILEISDGYRVRNEELGPKGIPFVRGGDIGDGWINTTTVDHIRPELAARVRAKLAGPDDVAFITKGTVGRAGRLRAGQPQVVFAPQVAYWRILNRSALDPRFAFYLIRSRAFQSSLYSVKTHGAMVADYVSISQQLDFTLSIPDIDSQRAIAHILGTLDDKIELNRRMNETLEAMGRALFKSWFVDFDPVYAKAEGRDPGLPQPLADLFPDSLEDSELGEIPKGWTVGILGDVAEHPRRGVQPGKIEPSTPYIALEHMPKRNMALSEWGTSDGLESNKFEFKRGEILFGKLRPYFHKVGIAPVDGVCSTDIVVVTPRAERWFGFVLGHMSSEAFVEYTSAGSTGTKMPRTSWSEMARYPVVMPTATAVEAFTKHIRPAADRVVAGIHESHTLAVIRDTLLPEIVSGQWRITAAQSFAQSTSQ
jgi:type I restriction enzyme S subunit